MALNDIYYKIYLDSNDEICIVCMQWFDEGDYNQSRFLSAGEFDTEKEAADFVVTMKSKKHKFPANIIKALDKFEAPVKNIFDEDD